MSRNVSSFMFVASAVGLLAACGSVGGSVAGTVGSGGTTSVATTSSVGANGGADATSSGGAGSTGGASGSGGAGSGGAGGGGGSTLPYIGLCAGYLHACGIHEDHSVTCWGWNASGQANAPPGSFQAVSCGYTSSCGLRDDGTLVCWGGNELEQSTPPAGAFVQLDATDYHACARAQDGHVECWGSNDNSATGVVPAVPSGAFTHVATSGAFYCLVDAAGAAQCHGPLPDNAPSGTFVAMEPGAGNPMDACGIRLDGTVACAVSTAPSGTFVQLDSHWNHYCGLRTDGSIACWPLEGASLGPWLDGPITGVFGAVRAGGSFSCALRADGEIVCWGQNYEGALDVP